MVYVCMRALSLLIELNGSRVEEVRSIAARERELNAVFICTLCVGYGEYFPLSRWYLDFQTRPLSFA